MDKQRLDSINCFLLDMDGTIYLGNSLIEGALDFLNYIRKQGKDYIFLTNNSSKNAEAYLRKLTKLGIEAKRENLITSTDILIYYLNSIKPGALIFPVGTKQFEQQLIKAGFNLIYEYEENMPVDYLVVGFDTSLNYEKLFAACRYIRNGVSYIATHPDFNCPLEGGVYMPDCGAIIEFIRASTGILPEKVVGKPNTMVIDMLVNKGFKKQELAIAGDRLYTDITLGLNSGITSILVLSGESTYEDVTGGEIKPDFIFNSVRDIYHNLRE